MELRRGLVIGGLALAAVGAHVGAAVFFSTHDPYSTEIFPPCPILAATGWQCPACGATRAAYSLMHGDIATAATMNPLLLALYGVAALLVASFAVTRRARPRLGNGLALSALGLLVSAALYTGVVRNLLAA
jgi:hypothetical protein